MFYLATSAVLTADVFAADSTNYKITATPTSYTGAANQFSYYDDYIRLFFVAPKSGNYKLKFVSSDDVEFYIRRYDKSYTREIFYRYFTESFVDSVSVNAGDTLYYKARNYSYKDSLSRLTVSYDTLNAKQHKLTLTSSSPNCSIDRSSGYVVSGVRQYLFGVGSAGYRTAGWKVTGDSVYTRDSSSNKIIVTLKSDAKLELQCKAGQVYDITTTPKGYFTNNDFYQNEPEDGIRFRYAAPDTNLHIIKVTPKSTSNYFDNYGADSLFTTKKRSTYFYSSIFFPIKGAKGQKSYYIARPYNNSYKDSIFIYAKDPAIVSIKGTTRVDTIGINDTLSVNITVPADSQLAGWRVESGSGTFTDTLAVNTRFIPTSANVTISRSFKQGKVYTLSESAATYSTNKNGSATKDRYYGVRAKFTAPDSGNYTLNITSKSSMYVYQYKEDSLFTRYKNYSYIYNRSGSAFTAKKGETLYFLLYQSNSPNENFEVKVGKALNVSLTVSGTGTAYIGSSTDYDNSHSKGDSVSLSAYADAPNKFARWNVTSGSCKVLKPTSSYTTLVINSDCEIKAYFEEGKVHPITATPTSYNMRTQSYGTDGNNGVRFSFKAPADGQYIVALSRIGSTSSSPFEVSKNTTSKFRTSEYIYTEQYSSSLFLDTLDMVAGDSIFYAVYSYFSSDMDSPLWASYTTTKGTSSLTVIYDTTLAYGSKIINPAYKNVAYPVSAGSYKHYRFDHWKLVKGNATIADSTSSSTTVIIKDSSVVKAVFKKGVIQELTTVKTKYTFEKDYYSEYSGSSIFFRWTPTDTLKHIIGLVFDSLSSVTIHFWGSDTSFYSAKSTKTFNGTKVQAEISGTPGTPVYFNVGFTYSVEPGQHSFTISEQTPTVITIPESSYGTAYPRGQVLLYPGFDTTMTAIPYGGYKFKSWELVAGKAAIANKDSASTKVSPSAKACTIQANYELDYNTVTAVNILDLDLNAYPGICVSVAVTDERNGAPIKNLEAEKFELYQDGETVPIQVSSMEQVGGVSVALVVDESGSMAGTRITEAKESIRQFISEMGIYDRTAIVGFTGGSNYKVHQTMTSDKSLLLAAVDGLSATGGTNIKTGAYHGVEQVFGETNPTAVIIFSDGDDGTNDVTTEEVIEYAKSLNTTIHSVGIGGNYEDPLRDLAEGTGGTYTNAPSAAELATIYADIRNAVQTRYVLCYNTPDMILDGDVHTVSVKVKFLEDSAMETTIWSEDFTPPVVRLTDSTKTLIGHKQPAGDSLVIEAKITTKSEVDYARIYIRHSDTTKTSFVAYDMVNVSDNLWRFVVSDSMAVAPGIDFYIVTADTAGLMGRGPSVTNPAAQPYTIPIDNQPPSVSMVHSSCVDTTDEKATLSFNILDNDGIYEAFLYYKNSSMVVYNTKALDRIKGENRWMVKIPKDLFQGDSVEFYLRATDNMGVTTRWKTFKNTVIKACEKAIEEEEEIPEIDSTRMADKAEIYDTDLDGTADFIKIRFQEKILKKIESIDTLFWNSPDGDWRNVTKSNLDISDDSLWVTAQLEPFAYGLTRAKDSPYLKIIHKKKGKVQSLKVRDKVGAVITSAEKHPGEFALNNSMDEQNEIYPDTLIIKLSEPIEAPEDTSKKSKKKQEKWEPWQDLFRYSENCEDTASSPIRLLEKPEVDSAGLVWTLLLEDRVVSVGNCIVTNHQSLYQDEEGNAMGRGGVEATGKDISTYLYKIKSNPSVTGIGKKAKWIPDDGDDWETLPDTISSVEVWTIAPYSAYVNIYDGMSQVVRTFTQEFGKNDEMENPNRGSDKHRYKVSFLTWDQRAENGRLAATGVYTWRIKFLFEDGHSELRLLNTGIKRKKK